jgi:hypothetical protein
VDGSLHGAPRSDVVTVTCIRVVSAFDLFDTASGEAVEAHPMEANYFAHYGAVFASLPRAAIRALCHSAISVETQATRLPWSGTDFGNSSLDIRS